jgi:hypothetical protein
MALKKILAFLMPHFETNDYAVTRVGRSSVYEIECPLNLVYPGERFDAVATYTCFVWLWWGFFPRQIGGVRPYFNPNGKEAAQ